MYRVFFIDGSFAAGQVKYIGCFERQRHIGCAHMFVVVSATVVLHFGIQPPYFVMGNLGHGHKSGLTNVVCFRPALCVGVLLM